MTPIKQAAAKFNEEHGRCMTFDECMDTIDPKRWANELEYESSKKLLNSTQSPLDCGSKGNSIEL